MSHCNPEIFTFLSEALFDIIGNIISASVGFARSISRIFNALREIIFARAKRRRIDVFKCVSYCIFFKNLSSHVCGVFVCLYVCVYWQSLGGGNMGAHYTVL